MPDIQILNNGESLHDIRTKINDNFDNTALKDLTNTGMITNGFIEIPQYIKLELTNGILTLLQGSQSFFGNGQRITATENYSGTNDQNGKLYAFMFSDGRLGFGFLGQTVVQDPENLGTHKLYFNSTTNKCLYDDTSSLIEVSLPIAIVTVTNNAISNIDQVFNGLGYIGSTVFLLPGCTGLVPHGREENGTFRNISTINTNITYANNLFISGKLITNIHTVLESTIWLGDSDKDYEDAQIYSRYYNTKTNYIRFKSDNGWINQTYYMTCGECIVTESSVTAKINNTISLMGTDNVPKATTDNPGVLRVASLTDEQNCQCEDAAITPKALSQVENYRQVSTAYNVGDTCACQYHAEMLLRCTTAGTTSATALDTSGTLVDQQEITDGTVVWTVEEITQSFNTADKSLSNLSSAGEARLLEGSMPIGTVIPLNCTADYVPDGCLPCDGAEYTKAQFGSLWTNYLTATTPLLNTCSYEDYATEITTYGQCGKFALDTVNEKFKVPTLKDGSVIQQALSDTELAKAYNAGLPNITGTAKLKQSSRATGFDGFSGAITSNGASFGGDSYSYVQESPSGFNFNASNSNPIYGNSTTVQPNAVALRYFIVVANGQINQSQMDWSAWASSLQGKANADLTNVTVMKRYPTETYINGANWYTVYSDGWVEQGGEAYVTNTQVSLLRNFTSTTYTLLLSASGGQTNQGSVVYFHDKTTSSFYGVHFFTSSGNLQGLINWRACGY